MMRDSYFFYDLETSGLDPKQSRIMQFAGQRTDLNLKSVGEPFNFLVKLANDSLPSPQAIMVTGITPQMTLSDGISEAEFLKIFNDQIATASTTFVGYNNVRFDDEFIRYTSYRNFYDPYEWHYKDDKKRWDLLDVIRMTRALRPDGINWPVDKDGSPTNKLTDITKVNNIAHQNAHDAMADVTALIEVADLIKDKQPKLFSYLNATMPDKNATIKLLESDQPLVYTSGGYFAHPQKTTVVCFLANLDDGGVLVYDLRQDPSDFNKLSDEKIKTIINHENEGDISPIIVIKPNKCPALAAPLEVLLKESEVNIGLSKAIANKHFGEFKKCSQELKTKVLKIYNGLYADRSFVSDSVDGELYDGFFDRADSANLVTIRDSNPESLVTSEHIFKDERLNKLMLLYKARNYSKYLSPEETVAYEQYRQKLLFDGGANSKLNKFAVELSNLETNKKLTPNDKYILEELKLYAESIVPSDI